MDNYISTLSSYCTLSNFVESTETISEDLAVVGLPPIAKYNEKDPGPTVASLINSVWMLLQNRQSLVDSKRDLEQKMLHLSEELNYLKEKQRRLDDSLLHTKDCLTDNKKLLLLKTGEETEFLRKIKSSKQEIQELKQQLKSKEWQFKHDLKRQQNEIFLLQTKLRTILSKERGEYWKEPSDSSTKFKSTDHCCKEDLLKKCIHRLENNVQTLVKENLELRKLLDNVNAELAEMLKTTTMSEHGNRS